MSPNSFLAEVHFLLVLSGFFLQCQRDFSRGPWAAEALGCETSEVERGCVSEGGGFARSSALPRASGGAASFWGSFLALLEQWGCFPNPMFHELQGHVPGSWCSSVTPGSTVSRVKVTPVPFFAFSIPSLWCFLCCPQMNHPSFSSSFPFLPSLD